MTECTAFAESPFCFIPIPFEFFYVCHSCERGIQLFNRKISNLIGILFHFKTLFRPNLMGHYDKYVIKFFGLFPSCKGTVYLF